ncbi:mechanosensitive ion channel family protein [Algoriphagus kandeliae]|nr:mechanosensitive ion channel domain-containing protein [Algoriphagus kandeliae]
MEIKENLPEIDRAVSSMRILVQDTIRQDNIRYLKGITTLLGGIMVEIEKYESIIDDRVKLILQANEDLAQIKQDSIFNISEENLQVAPDLFDEVKLLRSQISEIENEIFRQEITLTRFQVQLNDLTSRIISIGQYFRLKSIELNRKMWKKEVNFLWEPRDETFGSKKSTLLILKESLIANGTFIMYFFERNLGKLISFFIVLFVLGFSLKRTVRKIQNEKDFSHTILSKGSSVEKFPIISSFLIIVPFFFLVFDRPPLAFNSVLSLIFVFFSSWLIKDYFSDGFRRIWWIFLPLSLIGPTFGVNWEQNYDERFFLIVVNFLAVLFGLLSYKKIKGQSFKGKKVLGALILFLFFTQLFSFGANVLGRISIAKLYTITGVTSFFRGVSLYIFTHLVMQSFFLVLESKKNTDMISSFIDFKELEKRFSGILQLFALGIWLYGFLTHLGYFDIAYEYATIFLSKEYILGDTTFTFGTIFLFLIILLISSFLANSIAYFFSTMDQRNATSRKNRLGSSVLLIRLAVIIIGFFIALTAAKIPLDRITIVLGALSVGIGFGLQTIINNLVSGIILAFERPIQIGDEIEVGMNKGTVKEVGIRASKILAYDGSEIVVPNGDLLSQSLINWTLSDKRRRIELIIGVSYESDMKKVKTLLTDALIKNNILKSPPPRVFMQNFGDSSVDFRLLFWVESMDVWLEIRSDVMTSIFEIFQENGVEIPYPKRDLYLKSLPFGWKETITKPSNPSPEKEDQDDQKE